MPRPDRDETNFEYGCGLSHGLISPITSSRPGHTRVSPSCAHMKDSTPTAAHPSRRSFGTARRIRSSIRKPLGLNPWSGKSCPDPGRLSTFGVSGLYPCRRLTYRGACVSILAPEAVQVKHYWKKICGQPLVSADQNANGEAPSRVASRREHTTCGRRRLGSTVCPPHCRITESQQPLTGCTPRRGNRRRGCATCEVRCLRREPHRNAPMR